MHYRSQDLQHICAQFLKEKRLTDTFIKAVEKHNPRFGHLLRGKNRAVFESDIEQLTQFLQTTPEGLNFTPNRFIQPARLETQFHTKLREMNIQREVVPEFERKSKKLEILERVQARQHTALSQKALTPDEQSRVLRLQEQQTRILNMAKQQEELKKRHANIKTARKKSAKLERAKLYVEELVHGQRDALKQKGWGRVSSPGGGGGVDLAS